MAVGHALEDVIEIAAGLDVVELGGGEKRYDDGPSVGATIGTRERVRARRCMPSPGRV